MRLTPLKDSLFQKLDKPTQLLMRRSGVVPVLDPILPLWNLPEGTRTVVLIGGRGGAKTHGVSDFAAYQAAVNRKRCVVLRDEKSKIKGSILNEILLRYDDIPFNTNTERQETGLKYDKVQPNGAKVGYDIVFTMGFRASENAKTATMKGISDIDIAIIEEAEDIRDVDKYNQFTDGLRKEGCLVIIILNTPDIGHWILKRFFDCNVPVATPAGEDAKDYDGYFEVTPKKIDGFVCIQTSYEQNPKLPAAKVAEYRAYGDKSSHLYNLHHYLIAIKGYASTGRKGQILRKVKPISLADYMDLPFKEFYGQDFGTASPAGMVGVKFDKNNCYCREMNYLPMSPIAIGRKYCTLNLGPRDKIICDSADKDTCDKLEYGWAAKDLSDEDRRLYPQLVKGFFIARCNKGDGSIRAGIGIMDGLNLFAVSESTNLWEEIRNYVYDTDKNMNPTNDPIDSWNHLIDPWRYVIEDQRGKKSMFGI
jgi:phage terminase large subunit